MEAVVVTAEVVVAAAKQLKTFQKMYLDPFVLQFFGVYYLLTVFVGAIGLIFFPTIIKNAKFETLYSFNYVSSWWVHLLWQASTISTFLAGFVLLLRLQKSLFAIIILDIVVALIFYISSKTKVSSDFFVDILITRAITLSFLTQEIKNSTRWCRSKLLQPMKPAPSTEAESD